MYDPQTKIAMYWEEPGAAIILIDFETEMVKDDFDHETFGYNSLGDNDLLGSLYEMLADEILDGPGKDPGLPFTAKQTRGEVLIATTEGVLVFGPKGIRFVTERTPS